MGEHRRVRVVTQPRSSFVVVANRLPVDRLSGGDGTEWRTSPGGLVTALEPMLRQRDGVWIGWPGDTLDSYEQFEANGLSLVPIEISPREIEEYYDGMSNATLWPLYHDVVVKPIFRREWWDIY
nr:trehalose-6-phosphate synthase [Propionibacteriales bacterium]